MKKHSHNAQGLFRKEVPKMPEGYYSGDKPNPNLKAFVEDHIKENPYDPRTDDYNVPAFDKPIETTKATAIYNMHTYWSKKPHDAIRQYIRHYTKPGDLVLDPFCGSGGTNLAALIEGRKTIAIDISPAATFITAGYCTLVDLTALTERFNATVRQTIVSHSSNPHLLKCARCGKVAEIKYVLLAQSYQCVKCMKSVPISDCDDGQLEHFRGRARPTKHCPYCGERIKTGSDTRLGHIEIKALIQCVSGCKPKGIYVDVRDSKDLQARYFIENTNNNAIRRSEIGFDNRAFKYGLETHIRKDLQAVRVQKIADLFTDRNIIALDQIARSINWRTSIHDLSLMFVLTSMSLQVSRMVRSSNTATLAGTYYVPPEAKEVNPFNSYLGKYSLFCDLQEYLAAQFSSTPQLLISTQDARKLDISSNSIDYVFTDPPYGDKFQYAELNAVWEWLLGVNDDYWDSEVIINHARNLNEQHWAGRLRQIMSELYRVLKPGRWLSLCYHDTSDGTWALLQDIMAEVGFVADANESALFIDTNQKSYNQMTADKVNRRDLIINYYKPKLYELEIVQAKTAMNGSFREEVLSIIRSVLEVFPGITKDRVYDEMVSRTVRTGLMEPHNFEELLRQVADEVREPIRKDLFRNEDPNLFGTHEISRWYLKESQLDIIDTAESAKEDFAAENINKLVEKYIAEHPEKEGVHYSDIFEHFIYVVKDKPRRPLADWLLDYFYKTDEGTYRLPISEEEKKLKAEGRSKGTNRRIKRYIAFLEQGVTIPEKERPNDATLAEWIRHCKRSGLYEQGKLLYERGGLNLDNLPEEAMVNIEEDYQACIRMLSRTASSKKM